MQNTPSKFASWSLVASASVLALAIITAAVILQRSRTPIATAPQEVKNRLMTAEEIEQVKRVPDSWAISMTPAERANAIGLAIDEFVITNEEYEEACLRALNIGWIECRLGKTRDETVAEYHRRIPRISQQLKMRGPAANSSSEAGR